MQEPYGEGLATHSGPESCGRRRKTALEALTGVRAGWPLSLERISPRVPTASTRSEGNTGWVVIARPFPGPAGSETPCTRGNSLYGNREIPRLAGARQPRSASETHGKPGRTRR